MLDALKALIHESERPVLVSFKKKRNEDSSSFTEIIESKYEGKLRCFELDYAKSSNIYDYFKLPKTETAVIFEEGQNIKAFHGHKNVRKYIRAMFQQN